MFKVSARTVLELGSELISSDIIAFYELIKNGFDAGSVDGVEIRFRIILRRNDYLALRKMVAEPEIDVSEIKERAQRAFVKDAISDVRELADLLLIACDKMELFPETIDAIYRLNEIVVSDTGSGMSVSDLSKSFLTIGTPSRKKAVNQALQSGLERTPYLGEKGIGRLSAMRLGQNLKVETARSDDAHLNLLQINWADFEALDAMIEDVKVAPKKGGAKPSAKWAGTNIVIGDLSEDWTLSRVRGMVDREFSRLTDPFLDQKDRPRIAIFWNGNRVAVPWMDQRLIEHAHAHIKGSYEIIKGVPRLTSSISVLNLGFTHPPEVTKAVVELPDLKGTLIGTEQKHPDSALVSVGPFTFEIFWFNRKIITSIDGIGDKVAVKKLQEQWSGIQLFRDGFRIFPYGDNEDDWLALDRKAMSRKGYTLNKAQFVGRANISRTANPSLLDQTNREGLRETSEQQIFVGILDLVIDRLLFGAIQRVDRQYKDQGGKLTPLEAQTEIAGLEARAKLAIDKLKKIAPKDAREAVEDLQQALYQFREFAKESQRRVESAQDERQLVFDLAGVGLMVEVVAHELARASENALENIERLRKKDIPKEVTLALESLRAQMKSLSKRIRILDPLSVSGRQRKESFDLGSLIWDVIGAHDAQFLRHGIQVKVKPTKNLTTVLAVKGMIVQVLENLISNSKYWMLMRKKADKHLTPTITIALESSPPAIVYEDNGSGISVENKDRVFEAFFSLKEKSKRRGLGLFIARECAQYNHGSLILVNEKNEETGRLSKFRLELPGE
jgi:signal transduction histidine kinase